MNFLTSRLDTPKHINYYRKCFHGSITRGDLNVEGLDSIIGDESIHLTVRVVAKKAKDWMQTLDSGKAINPKQTTPPNQWQQKDFRIMEDMEPYQSKSRYVKDMDANMVIEAIEEALADDDITAVADALAEYKEANPSYY